MKSEKERGKKGRTFSRREFLRNSAIGAAGMTVGSMINTRIGRAQKPITFGLFGASSGPAAATGTGSLHGVTLWAERINREGGLLGRKVEIIDRDSMGKPEEGVRIARDYADRGVDIIFQYGPSSEAFAVAAISKDLKRLIASNNLTTEYTADPKVRSPYCFRFCNNNLFDSIAFGEYAGKISKELGLTRWYTAAADYVFGRDSVKSWTEQLMKRNPQITIIGQGWPKLFESDYTPHITTLMAAKPDAAICIFFAGDTISFVKQGLIYGMFEKTKCFFLDLANYMIIEPIVTSQGQFVSGAHSRIGYLRTVPNTKANRDFYDAYMNRFGIHPNEYVWRTYTAALLIEGAVKKAGTTDTDNVIKALEDLSVASPIGMGPGGTVTMRGRDHQMINYACGWAVSIPQEPYFTNVFVPSWDKLIEEETIWLRNKGWL